MEDEQVLASSAYGFGKAHVKTSMLNHAQAVFKDYLSKGTVAKGGEMDRQIRLEAGRKAVYLAR